MSLLSSFVEKYRTGFCTRGRGVSLGVTAVMLGSMMGAGLGIGTAHAQECDPVETDKLLVSDPEEFHRVGAAVAFDGDTAIFGAYLDDGNGTDSGAAYIFTRNGGVWTEQAKLLADDGAPGDYFGLSVSIDGDTALIGALFDDDNGDFAGSAYVFIRSEGVWTQQAKLLADTGAQFDRFGAAVAVSGDTALIGAFKDDDSGSSSGAAFAYTRDGGVWTQQQTILPDDGAGGDSFGVAVSLIDETAVIGASLNDDNGSNSGSVYVFMRDGSTWTQQAKLLPDDGAAGDFFGESVSFHNDSIAIGAYRKGDNGSLSGAAYIFTQDNGGVWTQEAKLLPADGATEDWFGYSVVIESDTAIIGAHKDNDNTNGIDAGSASVYTRSGGVWTEQAKIVPDDGAATDWFGYALALHEGTALIGAFHDDDNGNNAGAVYVYDLGCNDCPADLNGDGVVNTQDFLAFLGAWSAGAPLADWNGDGNINTLDFLAYLADWSAGC